MKMMKVRFVVNLVGAIALVSFLALSSCQENEHGGCDSNWAVNRNQLTAMAQVEDGTMRIEVRNSEPGLAIEIFQVSLTGDFMITATFDSFSPGIGQGGYAQLIVSELESDSLGFSGLSIGGGMIEAFVAYPFEHPDSRFTEARAGIFTIERTDSLITTSCIAGEMNVSKTRPFSSADLKVAFQVGSTNELLTGTTGITITQFNVSDDAGVESDKYDCDLVL